MKKKTKTKKTMKRTPESQPWLIPPGTGSPGTPDLTQMQIAFFAVGRGKQKLLFSAILMIVEHEVAGIPTMPMTFVEVVEGGKNIVAQVSRVRRVRDGKVA